MLAAAIRSHRLLAAINAARFGSCIGNCLNSRCIASKKRLASSWALTTGPPPARLAAMAATACSPISVTRASANANLPACLHPDYAIRCSIGEWDRPCLWALIHRIFPKQRLSSGLRRPGGSGTDKRCPGSEKRRAARRIRVGADNW